MDQGNPYNSPVTLVLRAIRLSDLQNVILKLAQRRAAPVRGSVARPVARASASQGPLQVPRRHPLATVSSTRCRGWCWCWKTLAAARCAARSAAVAAAPLRAGHRGDDRPAALHEGGIIHHDINPRTSSGIRTTGQVQLIDFESASSVMGTQAVARNLCAAFPVDPSHFQTGAATAIREVRRGARHRWRCSIGRRHRMLSVQPRARWWHAGSRNLWRRDPPPLTREEQDGIEVDGAASS